MIKNLNTKREIDKRSVIEDTYGQKTAIFFNHGENEYLLVNRHLHDTDTFSIIDDSGIHVYDIECTVEIVSHSKIEFVKYVLFTELEIGFH